MTTKHIIGALPAKAVEIDVGKTRVIIGDYAKFDLIYNDASSGRLTGKNRPRDTLLFTASGGDRIGRYMGFGSPMA